MAAKRTSTASAKNTDSSKTQKRTANFKINGQPGNCTVAVGGAAILQAEDTGARSYRWTVSCLPDDCDYQLDAPKQAKATLTPNTPGAYLIQLQVMQPDALAVGHNDLLDRTVVLPAKLARTLEVERALGFCHAAPVGTQRRLVEPGAQGTKSLEVVLQKLGASRSRRMACGKKQEQDKTDTKWTGKPAPAPVADALFCRGSGSPSTLH